MSNERFIRMGSLETTGEKMGKNTLYALGLATLLGLSTASGTQRVLPAGYTQKTEDLAHRLRLIGENIDYEFTHLAPNARTHIIFLPEEHGRTEPSRIPMLDSAITLDGILLEGAAAGEITPADISEVTSALNLFKSELPALESYLDHTGVLATDLKNHPETKDTRASQLTKSLRQFLAHSYQSLRGAELSPKIRLNAPATPYLTLPLRAHLIGIESSDIDRALEHIQVRQDLEELPEKMQYLKQLDEILETIKDDEMFVALGKFNQHMFDYLTRAESVHAEISNKIPKEYQNITSEKCKQLTVEKRSQAWIQNAAKRQGTYLLIGGFEHLRSVHEEAKKQGVEVITLHYFR